MKAIFIAYNQVLSESVIYILDKYLVRGYTKWESVSGRGSENGPPHFGTHAWPEMNSAIIAVVDDGKVEAVVSSLKKLDEKRPEQGIRTFIWSVEQGV